MPATATREGRGHRCRADAGNIIDVALGHGRGAEGRAHDDDFNVEAIGFECSPIARRQERQRGDGQAGVGDSYLGAPFLGPRYVVCPLRIKRLEAV